mgnify:CR=1 FL=1
MSLLTEEARGRLDQFLATGEVQEEPTIEETEGVESDTAEALAAHDADEDEGEVEEVEVAGTVDASGDEVGEPEEDSDDGTPIGLGKFKRQVKLKKDAVDRAEAAEMAKAELEARVAELEKSSDSDMRRLLEQLGKGKEETAETPTSDIPTRVEDVDAWLDGIFDEAASAASGGDPDAMKTALDGLRSGFDQRLGALDNRVSEQEIQRVQIELQSEFDEAITENPDVPEDWLRSAVRNDGATNVMNVATEFQSLIDTFKVKGVEEHVGGDGQTVETRAVPKAKAPPRPKKTGGGGSHGAAEVKKPNTIAEAAQAAMRHFGA